MSGLENKNVTKMHTAVGERHTAQKKDILKRKKEAEERGDQSALDALNKEMRQLDKNTAFIYEAINTFMIGGYGDYSSSS